MRAVNVYAKRIEAFPKGEQTNGSTQSVSCSPLFIGARGKEDRIDENIGWKTRRLCLLHGERFLWKNRCRHCNYLIAFQARLS
jgi:hypothetical protein